MTCNRLIMKTNRSVWYWLIIPRKTCLCFKKMFLANQGFLFRIISLDSCLKCFSCLFRFFFSFWVLTRIYICFCLNKDGSYFFITLCNNSYLGFIFDGKWSECSFQVSITFFASTSGVMWMFTMSLPSSQILSSHFFVCAK